jgi:hypothetical protein
MPWQRLAGQVTMRRVQNAQLYQALEQMAGVSGQRLALKLIRSRGSRFEVVAMT